MEFVSKGIDPVILSDGGAAAQVLHSPPPLPARPGKRVILYIGSDPKLDGSMFYLNLFWCLMSLCQERGIEVVTVIDPRPEPMRVMQPPEIDRILNGGVVDGLIGIQLSPVMTGWMGGVGVPWTVFATGEKDNFVGVEFPGMIRASLARLAELGCRTAGLMIPSSVPVTAFLEQIDTISDTLGIDINYEWILVSRDSQEQGGYEQMNALWALKHRPEGLLVYPDRVARGVVSAIMEKQIRVPDELRLVLHRNAELPYSVPVPCDWVEVSVRGVALSLLGNLEAAWAGHPMRRQKQLTRLVKGGPQG